MSSLLQTNGDDYPDAAEKHLSDAKSLLTNQRYDGAAYLSGYVVECSLKSLIQFETGVALKDHNFNKLQKNVIRLSAQANSKTAKYASSKPIRDLLKSKVIRWSVKIRYSSSGKITSTDSNSWFKEANDVFISTILEMRLDGVIT